MQMTEMFMLMDRFVRQHDFFYGYRVKKLVMYGKIVNFAR